MVSSSPLRGHRIRLTALAEDDLPTLVQWYQDFEFMRLFDARPARPPDLRFDRHGRSVQELEPNRHAVQRQHVTQRDQLAGPFGGHDPGQPGRGQHVPLRGVPAHDG